MNNPFRHLILAGASALLPVLPGLADVKLTPEHAPRLWQQVEFRIDEVPAAANNFDPDMIRVDAVISLPSGKTMSVPAFWTQDYTNSLVGGEEHMRPGESSGWRLRFTPDEAGDYELSLQVGQQAAAPREVATLRFSVPNTPPTGQHGWVKVAPGNRLFETTDGRALRLIGENVCWPQRGGTYDYEAWFDALQRSGQNFARLWMCPWWLPIEQAKDSLTRYNMDAAWRLDRIFELARKRGIYLLLCLDFHGMFQVDNPHWGGSGNLWPSNPYHKNNGGTCVDPNDFFTDKDARVLYQKRLRYLVARYGSNTHLLAWQFFNEIDNAYSPHVLHAPDVASWHRDMAHWLKSHDPFGHLVTTSLTGGSDRPEIWSIKELDFSMYHSYGDPAPARRLAALSDDYFRRYQKPVMVGEYGTDWRGWGGRTTDPHLRGQRQSLWGAVLGGSVGPAVSWWWEDIHLDNVYPVYSALSAILTRAGWREGQWTPAAVEPQPTPTPKRVGEILPGGAVFSGRILLNNVTWLDLDGTAAITGPLAAERASESLSNYLGGSNQAPRQRPLRLDAWWASDSNVTVKITELGGEADLRVKVDGAEVSRTALVPPAPLQGRSAQVSREVTVPVPPGRHLVELENAGKEWLYIDSLRAQGIRESSFPEGWEFPPDVFALRRTNRALLYVVSPWAVYPAGAQKYRLPAQRGKSATLGDWPPGEYVIHWFNTETGAEVAVTRQRSDHGALSLTVPDFEDDIAAVVGPEK